MKFKLLFILLVLNQYLFSYTSVKEDQIKVPFEYNLLIIKECNKYNIPYEAFIRHLYVESKFDTNAVNYNYKNGVLVSVDEGIGQLNSRWYLDFVYFDNNGKHFNPKNAFEAIPVIAHYLYRLSKVTKSWELAFTAYNCGLSRVAKFDIPASTKKHINFVFKREVWL